VCENNVFTVHGFANHEEHNCGGRKNLPVLPVFFISYKKGYIGYSE
jgi:hypothetical protein